MRRPRVDPCPRWCGRQRWAWGPNEGPPTSFVWLPHAPLTSRMATSPRTCSHFSSLLSAGTRLKRDNLLTLHFSKKPPSDNERRKSEPSAVDANFCSIFCRYGEHRPPQGGLGGLRQPQARYSGVDAIASPAITLTSDHEIICARDHVLPALFRDSALRPPFADLEDLYLSSGVKMNPQVFDTVCSPPHNAPRVTLETPFPAVLSRRAKPWTFSLRLRRVVSSGDHLRPTPPMQVYQLVQSGVSPIAIVRMLKLIK